MWDLKKGPEKGFCKNQVKQDGLMRNETVKISLIGCLKTRHDDKVLNFSPRLARSDGVFFRACEIVSD